ncbi:MAG: extracellular solute-binding protein [Treponema sp.]|jgi:raffinose/stachyose/melibiose transport system substrate-binding protein|nr:extracellular solute-binding protein [Treponema sp.]
MKHRLFVLVIAAALAMNVLPPLAAGGSAARGSPTGDEKITLNVMHFHTIETMENSSESKGYHAMKDKFIKEHPNVTINETIFQQTDYHTKIMALAAADEMPDIFFTKGSWVQNFYDNNLMANITSYVDEGVYRGGIFIPFTRGGKVYGIPIQFMPTSLVYYNAKLFNEIGMDHFPKTWDELVQADKAFKAKGIATIALGNKDKWPYESCIISTLGDRFTGTGWTLSIILNDGKAKFTDNEFISTLRYSQQMASMFNKDFNAINNEQSTVLYGSGKAASTVEGGWSISFQLQNSDPDVLANTRLAVLPAVPGMKGDTNATSGGGGWAQSASAKLTGTRLQAAMDFIKQTTGVEYSQFLMDDTGLPGPCEVPIKDKGSLSKLSQDYLDYMGSLKFVPIYDIQMDGAVIDVMNSKLQELLGGTASPEEVAAAIQAEQNKL